jgi:hypothetical protein
MNKQNPVTEKKLREILKDYPTEEKLRKILKDYPTKKDLDNILNKRLTDSQNAFRIENDYKFNLMREEFRAEFSKFANLILTAIDPLLKELETRQQDRELTTAQIEEVRARINDHEKRINKLERS